MNRMEKVFEEMQKTGKKILVAYFPLCDPALENQVEWADKYFRNGVTVLEMGLPYENPCYDGKIVRDSMERALKGHDINDAFSIISELRKAYPDRILQVMTYFEIVDKMGMKEFAKRCLDSGADAVLSPNVPPECIEKLDSVLAEYGLINLRFAPYHLTEEKVSDLEKNAKGYIFQQAVDGVTGPQDTTSPQVGINVKLLKNRGIKTPVVAGFGISRPEQAGEMKAMGADGVIVGSAVISEIIAGKGEEFIKQLRGALE
jgi:tryptophan synthase alpha chain